MSCGRSFGRAQYLSRGQVGFARIVTDQATCSSPVDVFVIAERNAAQQWLIETIRLIRRCSPAAAGEIKNARCFNCAALSPNYRRVSRIWSGLIHSPRARRRFLGSDHHDPASNGRRRRRARRTPEHAGVVSLTTPLIVTDPFLVSSGHLEWQPAGLTRRCRVEGVFRHRA